MDSLSSLLPNSTTHYSLVITIKDNLMKYSSKFISWDHLSNQKIIYMPFTLITQKFSFNIFHPFLISFPTFTLLTTQHPLITTPFPSPIFPTITCFYKGSFFLPFGTHCQTNPCLKYKFLTLASLYSSQKNKKFKKKINYQMSLF